MKDQWTAWLTDVALTDLAQVGGKNASLGEMFRNLGNVRIPNGFAVLVNSYREFVRLNGLERVIRTELAGLTTETKADELSRKAQVVRDAFLSGELPEVVKTSILKSYHLLYRNGQPIAVAVRSSATAEDLPTASFAGQQESFLNILGPDELLKACVRCYASLFTDRAIIYRTRLGIDHISIGLSIGVQEMIRSDLACSGVMFTLDTESGFEDVVLINSSYGLGESIVQGAVNPDEITIFKPTLREGFHAILRKKMGSKETKVIYSDVNGGSTKTVDVSAKEQSQLSLSDDDALALARLALIIEDHYSSAYGRKTPMDIEWAKDGLTQELFIVQARPETVTSRQLNASIETYSLQSKGKLLATGRSVGSKVGIGRARLIQTPSEFDSFRPGDVLVTSRTDPDWEPVMSKASAIVTEQGGRTCHAAIVSREIGIPAVIGCGSALKSIHEGQEITVSCAEGETGYVYEGRGAVSVERLDVAHLDRPKTKMMLTVADPSQAFRFSFLPNDGVGLARMEFVVNNAVGVHPLALTRFEQVEDRETQAKIENLTAGYAKKPDYFVDKLAEGIATIAAAFYPKPVILRFSDFKSNEYAHLLGGQPFEPTEENPMLGYRGASRYYDAGYQDGFALECAAISKVRSEIGLKNLKLMVPFCRTPDEGKLVLKQMERHGLVRFRDGLEVYVMCELPSNVLLAKEFADIFDGFSIGSNDLTQLILGVDRDSTQVAHLFDERNPAVKKMISEVISVAQREAKHIGICGQAPSDYPEFVEFLIREGIESISLNPDSIVKATAQVLKCEKEQRESNTNSVVNHAASVEEPAF